ncbi:MAG: DEAD/DEAH box helicase [Corynebacterium sp.]|nr:DEAD/DEAH box helicase [Corynebacterium sp.]
MSLGTANDSTVTIAPGIIVEVRDEYWLVTEVSDAANHKKVQVRGISDYVRDEEAVFFDCFDDIKPLDPSAVKITADKSPNFRKSRLWLETTLRQTPLPLNEDNLAVADSMLVDTLDYQRTAVKKILAADNHQPRLLIADAVGLGKTVEIGLILAELIKRGRGDRILIVTPRAVLEQMQKEMWNRFAIPFVRLDSTGIQHIRQELPATRNPFTYYNRAIISIDTLKQPKFRAYLEKVRWDAVVIDEAHNAVNAGTLNNKLVRMLSTRTDALVLASATPHNGNPKAFGELLRLLDPAAVDSRGLPIKEYISKLVIRRHRNSPEVRSKVADDWAERGEPVINLVTPSPEELAVARELRDVWTGDNPPSALNNKNKNDRLFPWTLVKAYLSSPAALGASIEARKKSLTDRGVEASNVEFTALNRLQELNDQITPENCNKFKALVEYLKSIGIKRNSDTRVVIFSERRSTLPWLAAALQEALKLGAKNICTMTGGDDDLTQMHIIERFKRKEDPLRVLITGDVASEGVNLHQQCHHLVHWDIPWSLIRIQQRNGRIDRYGQRQQPVIATMLLDTAEDDTPGELRVLTKLLEREKEVSKELGDAALLMGKHNIEAEEDAIRKAISGEQQFEEVVPTVAEAIEQMDETTRAFVGEDPFALFFGNGLTEEESAPTPQAKQHASYASLYPNDIEYLQDALLEAFDGHPNEPLSNGGVGWAPNAPRHTVTLNPTPDLCHRFRQLPQDYIKDLDITKEISLTDNKEVGKTAVKQAVDGAVKSNWPSVHYLGPLHPVTSWAADRALTSMSRQEIPIITGKVGQPTIILLGTVSNCFGQTITRTIYASEIHDFGGSIVSDQANILDLSQWLDEHTSLLDISGLNTMRNLSEEELETYGEYLKHALVSFNGVFESIGNELENRSKAVEETFRKSDSGARIINEKERREYTERIVKKFKPETNSVRPLIMIIPE